jgi:hypothetical protein
MYNKGIVGTQYDQRMKKAGAIAGARSGMANMYQKQASAAANAASQKTAAKYGMAGSLIGAAGAVGGGYASASADGGVKYGDGGKKDGDDRKKSVAIVDALTRMGQGLAQYGATNSAAKASLAGGVKVETPDFGFGDPGILSDYTKDNKRDENKEGYDYDDDGRLANGGFRYEDGGIDPEMYQDGVRYDEALENGELEANPMAQEELLEYLRGIKSPEEGEQGRIIEGNNYAGDELPDRINSGESVSTVKMQDKNKQLLEDQAKEIRGFKKLMQMIGEK